MGKTENSNILKNRSSTNDLDDLDDFSLILNRSGKIDKIINIDNHVIKLEHTYTSESNYSDEVLYYLTQTIDKVNQFKYNNSINNTNSNNNFQIYNSNYIKNIDVSFQYELLKRDIYNNPKAFNIHEHRKIPYEEEKRETQRRRFHNNQFFHKKNSKYNYKNNRNPSFDYHEKNRDKVKIGRIPEFMDNNNNAFTDSQNEEIENNRNKSSDRINYNGYFGNNRRKNLYNDDITSYNPFQKSKVKNFQEDDDK